MRSDVAGVQREAVPAGVLRLASDERLVACVRAGSERAFEELFDRHHRAVLAFCRHMLGSPADAEDALQHTFFAAYRDLLRSEKPIVLRPWLYAIARHRCVSMLRERRERPVAELPEATTDHLAASVALREDLRTTLIDVARLPEDQRAALVLAELGDVSHEEIATILGCERDKVKALVFQARASLTADRKARDTPCSDIREQLVVSGGALRHANLRRHLRDCADCRAFRGQMRGRRRLRVLLPFAPGVGLKRTLLGVVSGWGGGSLGGAAMTAGAVLATATVVGGGAAGLDAGREDDRRARPVDAATPTATRVERARSVRGLAATREVAVVRPDTRVREAAPAAPEPERRSAEPAGGPGMPPPIPEPVDAASAPPQANAPPVDGDSKAPPGKPTGAPVAKDRPKPVPPGRAGKDPKPPRAESPRRATPGPPENHGKPPDAPAPVTPAAPEPPPPGGAENRKDEANGHRGNGRKP